MHNAPPVVYPLGPSRVHAWILAGLWVAGLCVVVLWSYLSEQKVWQIFAAVCTVALVGVAAHRSWKSCLVGHLAWDGQVWRWESSGHQPAVAEQRIHVLLDLQHMMLLRFENQAKAQLWLWPERHVQPERWLDFRRAVYSPHKPARVSASPEVTTHNFAVVGSAKAEAPAGGAQSL